MKAELRFRGAVMPILFIVAGVVLLLNSLDIVDWAIWPQMARLWPVVVIGFGVNLLLQHFRRTRI